MTYEELMKTVAAIDKRIAYHKLALDKINRTLERLQPPIRTRRTQ